MKKKKKSKKTNKGKTSESDKGDTFIQNTENKNSLDSEQEKKNKKTKKNESSDSNNEDSLKKSKKTSLVKNSDDELNKNNDSMKGETIISKIINQESNIEKEKNSTEDMISQIQNQKMLTSTILDDKEKKENISSEEENNINNKGNTLNENLNDNKSNINSISNHQSPEKKNKSIISENEKKKSDNEIENESNMYPSITMREDNNLNQGDGFYMSNIKNENENDIENENKEKKIEEEENKENSDPINNLLKNKDVSIEELFDATFEINKTVNDKIKNYQNDMEKIIKKEFDDLKMDNSLDSKLGLYLKFRDTYHLTYRETVKFENSNIKCKYCEKDIFGYIYKIKVEPFKEITYCSSCIYKIIPKFKSPITINLVKSIEKPKDIPERINEYKVEIENIEVNGNSISTRNVEYNYGKVPNVIKLKINLKNTGNNDWPSESKLDIDKLNHNNFFSTGHSNIGSVKPGKEKTVEGIELKGLDKLPPGKYSLILGICLKNKSIFGDINDMTIKFSINI